MTNHQNLILRNLWYLALPSEKLKSGNLVARQIALERLVFGRDKQGAAFALKDNCPHRGVPLSNATVLENGNLQCCYHGWEFDAAGVCRKIPALAPDSKGDVCKIRAFKYPVRELNNMIWVYIPEKLAHDLQPKEAVPSLHLDEGQKFLHVESIVLPTNIDHSVIGLIDPAHVTFVHQSWFWRSAKSLKLKTKNFEPIARGFKMVRHAPSSNSKGYRLLNGDVSTEIFFEIPGNRLEFISIGDKHKIVSLTTLTPVSENTTELNHFFFSTLSLTKWLGWPLKKLGKTFIGQDVGVFHKLAKGLENDPQLILFGEPDAQARWYYDLKRQWNAALLSGEEFRNPLKPETLRWVT